MLTKLNIEELHRILLCGCKTEEELSDAVEATQWVNARREFINSGGEDLACPTGRAILADVCYGAVGAPADIDPEYDIS